MLPTTTLQLSSTIDLNGIIDASNTTVTKEPVVEPIKFAEWIYQANGVFELIDEEGLIDFDLEEAKKGKTNQEQQKELITQLYKKSLKKWNARIMLVNPWNVLWWETGKHPVPLRRNAQWVAWNH